MTTRRFELIRHHQPAREGHMRRTALLLAMLLALAGCKQDAAPSMATTPATTTTTLATGHPNPAITPGVVLTTSRGAVCTPGWASQHRKSLTAKQKGVVLRAYGYPTNTKVAEWDHLVSLELGGGNGTQNIWPQISDPDQQRKDRLENALHAKVCAGRLGLAAAQDEIRQFWRYW